MLSIWPKFYTTTANYKELDAAGYIYRGNVEMGNRDWVGPGYLNSNYDPYSQGARDMYWRQIWDKLGRFAFRRLSGSTMTSRTSTPISPSKTA